MSARMRPNGQFVGSEGSAGAMETAERALAAGAPDSLACKLKRLVSVSYVGGDLDAAIAAAKPYTQKDHGVRGVLSLLYVDDRAIENLSNPGATKATLEALSQFGAVMLAGVDMYGKHDLDENPRIIAVRGDSERDFVEGYGAVEEFLFEHQPLPAPAAS